jgi:leucyl/phenylalanyl-tRNA--protein transferase
MPLRLDPETLLSAYCRGVFPMTDSDGHIRWYTADPRGIIPLDAFRVPHTLAQFMRSTKFSFDVRINHDFPATMHACMTAHGPSWISPALIKAYTRLHSLGFAHSVETYHDDKLVGALYGVSIGGAFFGESMFHSERDASKVALVTLLNRLKERNYDLLDAQAATSHLSRFGCIEIPAADYLKRLEKSLPKPCTFI